MNCIKETIRWNIKKSVISCTLGANLINATMPLRRLKIPFCKITQYYIVFNPKAKVEG